MFSKSLFLEILSTGIIVKNDIISNMDLTIKEYRPPSQTIQKDNDWD